MRLDRDAELGQPAVDEGGGHRTLSDRAGHALRPVAHVARGEEPDPAGLEEQRIAVEQPDSLAVAVDTAALGAAQDHHLRTESLRLPSRVHRGGETGGPRTDHDEVAMRALR